MSAAIVHRTRTSVRYHETDQMGVVHHSNYICWFELGRTEMMKAHGLDYAELERAGCLLAVVDVGLRHVAPARFGDEIVVETTIAEVERVRVRFEYAVRRVDGAATLLCRGHTLLAGTDRQLRPRRLPEAVRTRMTALAGVTPATPAPPSA
ncbi:MAG: acyl-CoA thioesterase [Planctomycetes bacterium]|nr:acyl-CoA thioesterase [Planctomycetota bacterium]